MSVGKVDWGAFAPNPLEQLAAGISQAAQQQPYNEAQLQSVGQQVLQRYLQPATTPSGRWLASDPRFMAGAQRIAKMYGLPLPMLGSQGGSWDSGQSSPGNQAPTQPASGPTPDAASGATPPSSPGAGPGAGPMQVGSPQQTTAPNPLGANIAQGMGAGGAANPQQRGQVYQSLLAQIGADPKKSKDPMFMGELTQAAAAVGRGPRDVQMDVQAAVTHGQGSRAALQAPGAAPATQGTSAAASPSQPPQAAAGGPYAPQTPENQPGPQTAAFGDRSVGPLRIDVNAALGRTLSFQDFNALSGMSPDQRTEALVQQGWDPREFDQKWLNSSPSLGPYEQAQIAEHVTTSIGQGIKEGDSVDLIRERIAPLMSYLSPAQQQAINDTATDQVNAELQGKLQNWQTSGLIRRQTLNFMERKFSTQQQNVQWDHNFKYQVLTDKNAQFSQEQSVRQQNADTSYSRLQEEITRDNQNGVGPNSPHSSVKTPELITNAKGLLTSINSAISEMNGHIISATSAGVIDPKHPGVNDLMAQQVQQQIDAYNNTVDMLRARGVNIFSHYTGPDQSAVNAAAAGQTAQKAVQAQGMAVPGGKTVSGWNEAAKSKHYMPDNREIRLIGGKWVYQDGSPAR